MDFTPFRRTRIAPAIVGAGFALAAGHAVGAAFALQENNGVGLGNAYAGGAAAAEDVSYMWSNAAALSKLAGMQAAAVIHFITPSFKLGNEGSLPAFNQQLGGTGGDAGSTTYVPNVYVGVPINRQWSFGLGVNVPFGLKTEYDSDWLGRYQGIKSDVKTININPAFAFKASDTITIGVGANWQSVDATLTSHFNYSAGIAQGAQGLAATGAITLAQAAAIIAATPNLDSSVEVQVDDDAWGWNVGILVDLSPTTRIGASYRSEIKYGVLGTATFANPALPSLPPPLAPLAPVVQAIANGVNAQLVNTGATSNITLPAIANLSIFTQLNPQWDLMADLQWTGWSSLKDLTFVRTNGTVLSSTPENFRDAWRFSVGANYRHTDQWKFRFGTAYDESPVNDTDRTVRLPDENRWWLAAGAQYAVNRNLKLDAGFAYIWVATPSIDQDEGNPARVGLVKGSYNGSVILLSLQGTYTF